MQVLFIATIINIMYFMLIIFLLDLVLQLDIRLHKFHIRCIFLNRFHIFLHLQKCNLLDKMLHKPHI